MNLSVFPWDLALPSPSASSASTTIISALRDRHYNPRRGALCTSNNGVYVNKSTGVVLINEVLKCGAGTGEGGGGIQSWILIPSTFDPMDATFVIRLYSSSPNIKITRIQ